MTLGLYEFVSGQGLTLASTNYKRVQYLTVTKVLAERGLVEAILPDGMVYTVVLRPEEWRRVL